MACLGWLLNLDFAGSPVPEPVFTGNINFTLTSYVLPHARLWDYVAGTHELKGELHHTMTINSVFPNGVTLIGNVD